jgi:D-sedoheptulose 7-phosphate isomerase
MEDSMREGGGAIDGIYYCLHHPEAALREYRRHCDCRKPEPGLLLQAARELGINLPESYMVGDGIPDVLAGQRVGATTVFLSPRKPYVSDELALRGVKPDYMADGLPAAAELIRNLEAGRRETVPISRDDSSQGGNGRAYSAEYVNEAIGILQQLDVAAIERTVGLIARLRERRGRLFLLGVGGGAGHASHAVCDFRKICRIEAYTPTDNVSELTARINDDGWETAYADWLRGSHLSSSDMVFVFSVGGGDAERNISANLVRALEYSQQVGASICGVVGRDGGFTAQVADACVLIRVPNPATVTPHTEAFQALVWHLLVSHPKLRASEMKWESVKATAGALLNLAG